MGQPKMSPRKRPTEEIVNSLNEIFCPQLERALYKLADKNYVYCPDTANQVKKVAHEMKRIRGLPENTGGNLVAILSVDGQNAESISNGLIQIAREWIYQKGSFIKSCHALGLGIDMEKSPEHTTIYAAAKFY